MTATTPRAGLGFVRAIVIGAVVASSAPLAAQEQAATQAQAPRDTTTTDSVPARPEPKDFLGRAWDASTDAVGTRLTGEVVTTGEVYMHAGAEARRPGQSWRAQYAPHLELVGGVSVSADILLSSEGSELRQNINQAGFTPRWGWGAAHLGDFSRGYSGYTTQGLRVRGAGLDLTPGWMRFSVQGGRTQRAVASLSSGPVFRRNMMAAKLGVGSDGGSFLDVTVLKAKDDPNSVERTLLVIDPTVLDTLVDDVTRDSLLPRLNTFNRPQENLVLGVAGQLPLFSNALVIRGEAARSAITRDLLSPQADPEGLSGAARAVAKHVMPIHLSTSDDAAYNVEVNYNGRAVSAQAAYEEVGAGYSSLGLGYLINDRRAYRLGGSARLLGGRVALQGQYQHQNDNLLDQLESTTSRDAISATAAVRVTDAVMTTLAAVTNTIENPAPVDTFVVDNRALAITSSTVFAHSLFGRPSSTSLTYGLQQTSDGNTIREVPGVVVHNAAVQLQVPLTRTASVSPSLSTVLTRIDGQEDQRNVFLGFRGQARFRDGRLRTTGDVNQNFNGGRRVFGMRAQASYELPHAIRLTLQGRHTQYSAFATRPAFRESFVTTTLARSF